MLLSDGEDTASLVTDDQVLELARKTEISIYAISLRPSRRAGPQPACSFSQAAHLLTALTRETGGQVYFPDSLSELDAVYDRIAEELRTQYSLGYVSSNMRRDGKWRRVVVRTPCARTCRSATSSATTRRAPDEGPAPAFVYILHCRDGSLYTGSAKDLGARMEKHRRGRASRYTRARLPVRLVWSCTVASWGAALREEYRIKQLTRAAKLALVRSHAQLRRRRAPEDERPARGGMRQRQSVRVQAIAAVARAAPGAGSGQAARRVERVAHERMARRGQVDADLVRAARCRSPPSHAGVAARLRPGRVTCDERRPAVGRMPRGRVPAAGAAPARSRRRP